MKFVFIREITVSTCLGLGLLAGGCAQKVVASKLDTKLSQEVAVNGNEGLKNEAQDYIESSKLNPEAKTQLRDLQKKSEAQFKNYRDESLKLRSILIQDVFASSFDKSEVQLIQKKMAKLDKQRLAFLFDTIDKANGIMGRETEKDSWARQKLMHQFTPSW